MFFSSKVACQMSRDDEVFAERLLTAGDRQLKVRIHHPERIAGKDDWRVLVSFRTSESTKEIYAIGIDSMQTTFVKRRCTPVVLVLSTVLLPILKDL